MDGIVAEHHHLCPKELQNQSLWQVSCHAEDDSGLDREQGLLKLHNLVLRPVVDHHRAFVEDSLICLSSGLEEHLPMTNLWMSLHLVPASLADHQSECEVQLHLDHVDSDGFERHAERLCSTG